MTRTTRSNPNPMVGLYSSRPTHRLVTILADVAVALVLGLCVLVGMTVKKTIDQAARPLEKTATALTSLESNLDQARDKVDGVPLLGDKLASPFSGAGDATGSLTVSVQENIAAIHSIALLSGIVVAVIPMAMILLVHLSLRWRGIARRRAIKRLLNAGVGPEFFAYRSLYSAPLSQLVITNKATVAASPAVFSNPFVLTSHPKQLLELASQELHRNGMNVPKEWSSLNTQFPTDTLK